MILQLLGGGLAIVIAGILLGVAIRAGWLMGNAIFNTHDSNANVHVEQHCKYCCPEPAVVPCFGCRGEKVIQKYDEKMINTRLGLCDECSGRGSQTADEWERSRERSLKK